ncbi:MAG: helix-turn-helix transcriptional regulator [Firmicutes bacterium]|nr:helix-turn-helix transcriptional regulator [Bacillota bacterium]
MSIGSRIKEVRLRQHMTQEELARRIGVTKGAIANYENEVSTPKTELMYKILDVLQCDANYLYQDMVPSTQEFIISYAEREHLKKYRGLDSYGRRNIDMLLENEYDRCQNRVIVFEDSKFDWDSLAAHARVGATEEAIAQDLEQIKKMIQEMKNDSV